MILVLILLGLLVGAALLSVRTIDQAYVGVVTMFGKYRRALPPGLNFVVPVLEQIHSKVPVQNQTAQLQFAAITRDQASVHFTATIIFTVSDHLEETIKRVAFTFINYGAFSTALNSAVEASVREYVATQVQADVLGLRGQIVDHAKTNLDEQLASWGYTLVDLTVNDISFDSEIMASMSRVVAAKNAKTAAEFEGEALLIKRTKEAEAEGAAIKIAAENEATAAGLRGRGLADFRGQITDGLAAAAEELRNQGIGPEMLYLQIWTETLRDAARDGKGNIIFFDGSLEGQEATIKRLQALQSVTAIPAATQQAVEDAARARREREAAESEETARRAARRQSPQGGTTPPPAAGQQPTWPVQPPQPRP